jgi:Eukaryotic aspartyl protease
MVWVDVENTFFWQAPIQGFNAGGKTIKFWWPKKVVLDTGTSLAYIDGRSWRRLKKLALAGTSYYSSNGDIYTSCTLSDFQSIYL